MALPKSVTKVDRQGGVTFISNVDRVNHTLDELCRAALRDTAKLIRRQLIIKLKKLPGMGGSKRIYTSTQYWNRSRSKDLQMGFKADAWYGARSELGTHGSPARGILRGTVYENIDQIQQIQAKYLSGLSAENPSLSGTSEGDYKSPNGDES
ncbi:hypothetical protein [Jeotgalibacillus proteolyticus]|uniref:HK97 gp10 family phage protein n=1 Tax=Jeotgalibacillus proteolyticus TaxID=2082395 RepID=A0A2S5GFY7_9BACL|nr:hypothetical protein [Jeotgalibacillus proteolyticus]PPA71909.1 hypothetical protein C4B60_00590 [Jeotgalibacillus proteolyticus]